MYNSIQREFHFIPLRYWSEILIRLFLHPSKLRIYIFLCLSHEIFDTRSKAGWFSRDDIIILLNISRLEARINFRENCHRCPRFRSTLTVNKNSQIVARIEGGRRGKWSLFLVNQVDTVNRWIVIAHRPITLAKNLWRTVSMEWKTEWIISIFWIDSNSNTFKHELEE